MSPRRTVWCRPKSSPRLASSPPALPTRSRTLSILSTISRPSRSSLLTNCERRLPEPTSTTSCGTDQRDCGYAEGQSRQGRAARQARRFDRQEHAAAFAPGLRRAPAGPISTPSSRRASISPIMGRGPRSRASISPWRVPLIRPPARSMSSRRRSRGCCSI